MNAGYLLDPLSIPARISVVAATLECPQLGGRDSGDSVIGTLRSPSVLFLAMLLPAWVIACNPHNKMKMVITDILLFFPTKFKYEHT
jgi:hypothetical protein